jgi:1-aminocyclopropane-1-carboxylate deaminase
LDLNQIINQLNLQLPSRIDYVSINTKSKSTIGIKRDDLIHPIISGNKWRKLKYHLDQYYQEGYSSVISFGGAYSNHLYALSHVCMVLNIPCTLFVRGDGYDPTNSTLSKLKSDGSKLMFIDRTAYRQKDKAPMVQEFLVNNKNVLIIPEGGSGPQSRLGLFELCEELDWINIDQLFVSAGTGATAAAIYSYIYDNGINTALHVISALKGDFMKSEICAQLDFDPDLRLNVYDQYHFGGYAKMPENLIDFERNLSSITKIHLDLVYNAKTAFGMIDLINKNVINSTDRIIFLNTGGLST